MPAFNKDGCWSSFKRLGAYLFFVVQSLTGTYWKVHVTHSVVNRFKSHERIQYMHYLIYIT